MQYYATSQTPAVCQDACLPLTGARTGRRSKRRDLIADEKANIEHNEIRAYEWAPRHPKRTWICSVASLQHQLSTWHRVHGCRPTLASRLHESTHSPLSGQLAATFRCALSLMRGRHGRMSFFSGSAGHRIEACMHSKRARYASCSSNGQASLCIPCRCVLLPLRPDHHSGRHQRHAHLSKVDRRSAFTTSVFAGTAMSASSVGKPGASS